MSSIYDAADEWSDSKIYNKNDYVKDVPVSIATPDGGLGSIHSATSSMMLINLAYSRRGHIYWYSLVDGNEDNPPSLGDNNWGGVTTFTTGPDNLGAPLYPHFVWAPSYNATTSVEPRVLKVRFGDGYSQRTPDGINNNLITCDLTFDNRTEKETTAILHFLNVRRATEPFVWTPPAPFASANLFICKKFTSNFVFNDNFTVKAQFEQTPA